MYNFARLNGVEVKRKNIIDFVSIDKVCFVILVYIYKRLQCSVLPFQRKKKTWILLFSVKHSLRKNGGKGIGCKIELFDEWIPSSENQMNREGNGEREIFLRHLVAEMAASWKHKTKQHQKISWNGPPSFGAKKSVFMCRKCMKIKCNCCGQVMLVNGKRLKCLTRG